jgi:hypothetical protein
MILTRAFDVHEVGVGRLHKALQLVGALLARLEGVEKIDGELFNRRNQTTFWVVRGKGGYLTMKKAIDGSASSKFCSAIRQY